MVKPSLGTHESVPRLDLKGVGARIRRLRKDARWTQRDLAARTGLTQEAVSAIESGRRALGLEVLRRIATGLGVTIDHLLQEQESLFERLLREEEQTGVDSRCVRQIVDLCRRYVGLEALTRRARRWAPEYPSPAESEDAHLYGERIAAEERRRLGLGLQPVADLATVVEEQGAMVLAMHCLPEHLDGGLLCSEDAGAFILLNARRAPEHQLFTLAHEYSHFLMHRKRRSILDLDIHAAGEGCASEKMANAFASAFLMPAEIVRQSWDRRPKPLWLRLMRLRRQLGVSYRTLGYRMVDIGCITAENRKRIEAQEPLLEQGERELFSPVPQPYIPSLSDRLMELALGAYLEDEITTSYLAESLDTDIMTAQRKTALARKMAELTLD